MRQGYSGHEGSFLTSQENSKPLTPIETRAAKIFGSLDELNIYRMALEKVPLAHPVQSANSFTSGFGHRWGRMHNDADFAAPHATPIYSTADGLVIQIGWRSGYGRLIKIKHGFGSETRCAHLSKIRVQKGQWVSRGEYIGDMGDTGHSTGTHLHYEVQSNGEPVNPMKYIKATRNVF